MPNSCLHLISEAQQPFPPPAPGILPATGNPPYSQLDIDGHTESNHDTPLTLACAGGHEDLVQLLLSRGANIEHRDKKGEFSCSVYRFLKYDTRGL